MRFVPKIKAHELAKACAVLMHSIEHHPIMLIPYMFDFRDGKSKKLCNPNDHTLIRGNTNMQQSFCAFNSTTRAGLQYAEFSYLSTEDSFVVFGYGSDAPKDENEPIMLTGTTEEEYFQRSLVLTDIELYTLEFFTELRRLEVPSIYMVLGELCKFISDNEKLYHSLEKRYDEFCSTK